jgi:methanogenic corrinoid protein MtbC1
MQDPHEKRPKKLTALDPCWSAPTPADPENGDGTSRGFPEATASQHPEEHMQWLVKTIEAEIIPRLMAAHHDEEGSKPVDSMGIQSAEVREFTEIILNNESAICHSYIDGIRSRGVSLKKIYLDLLTPAARRLDDMWTQDQCDFTQITIALWRIQQVMCDLSPAFRTDSEQWGVHRRKIMLMPVPGSQHTLGVLMVAEFFRRAGWAVWGEPAAGKARLVEAISQEWFDIAGISVGSEPQLEGLSDFVSALRKASKNKSLLVIAGGPLLIRHPEYASAIGADAVAKDAEHAIVEAERLLALHQQQISMKAPQRAM